MLEFCRREWTSLLTALAFLTRLGPARCLDAAALSRAVRYYPVAGLAAGVAQTLPAAVLMLAHPAWGAGAAWLYVAAGCMFVGFGAKASAFPVHVWLPQSYT